MRLIIIIFLSLSALAGAVGDDNAPPADRFYLGVLVEDPVIHLRPAALQIPTTAEVSQQITAFSAAFKGSVRLRLEISELERLSPDGRSWLSGRLSTIKSLSETDTTAAAALLDQTKSILKGWGLKL